MLQKPNRPSMARLASMVCDMDRIVDSADLCMCAMGLMDTDPMECYAADELSYEYVFSPPERERTYEARDKEMDQMKKRRLTFAPKDKLTQKQMRSALRARMVYVDKRPTQIQLDQGLPGRRKGRLVAMDLKHFRLLPHEMRYAPTPSLSGFRLMVAAFNSDTDVASSTDFDVAFLQSDGDRVVLIVVKDPETGEDEYYWCEGAIYGMQDAAAEWSKTLRKYLEEIGFKPTINIGSMYWHPERNIMLSCHVDDPFIVCRGKDKATSLENEEWIHTMLEKRFDTKGRQKLTPDNSLDYLSMRVSMDKSGKVYLDNEVKIDKWLKEANMENCKPSSVPLTHDILKEMGQCKEFMDAEEKTKYKSDLGKFQWIVETTHPMMATAVSIMASFGSNPPVVAAKGITMMYRWLKHTRSFALTHMAPRGTGFQASADADWAGMYRINGDTRSRTGSTITYDGFMVAWRSGFQNCKATGYKEGQMLPDLDPGSAAQLMPYYATSTGDAEGYALGETVKFGKNVVHVGDELGISIPLPFTVGTDSTAAQGFIKNVGKASGMRHVDARCDWVQSLRNGKVVEIVKIPGTDNLADGFTKLLLAGKHREFINRCGVKLHFAQGGHEMHT